MTANRENLLAPSGDRRLLLEFARRLRLPAQGERAELLERVARAFSRIPYENLTKILREAERGPGAPARRTPAEVLGDHFAWGAGGTCFSLTAALLHLVRALDLQAEPILADRHYGPDTHCALLVWLDGRPHLLDPGFLIVRPVPLDPGLGEQRLATSFNEVVLAPRPSGDRVDLYTETAGRRTYRLTLKTSPVDAGQFLRAWDASFQWDMMRYPVLTKADDQGQWYLQGRRLLLRTRDRVKELEAPRERLAEVIARHFGLDPRLAAKALRQLERRGAADGRAAAG